LVGGRDTNNSSPEKYNRLRNISQGLGLILILWYDANRGQVLRIRTGGDLL